MKAIITALAAFLIVGCANVSPSAQNIAESVTERSYVLPEEIDRGDEENCPQPSKLIVGNLSELSSKVNELKDIRSQCLENLNVFKNWIIRNHKK